MGPGNHWVLPVSRKVSMDHQSLQEERVMVLKAAFKYGCILALSCTANIAVAEPTSISMTKNNKNDKFEVVLDDKNAGRLIFFVAYHGTWKQTKGSTLIDGVN